ncbi:hypothetical protein G3N55_06005 [Dissulfurirhabdus thermomarina]|uniref:Uncharacterized protein n=1 Tax=Dissulfurirhabdus thermomarina TaxID=1765737 RepID=A0A6N9TMC9_DISTH|nr:hypothetical protein [Dissulfurirhabdus thermomarina]NDY42395.1 hypothetical protein [Dissulfurirhabdus thermomarina]NMX23235.1 hypothetical protein [Dissulfurirhabdus thermomarina]
MKARFRHFLALHRRAVVLALAGVTVVIALLLWPGYQDGVVKGNYHNPYTPQEVRRMMAYHGALVARFDGRQWWFLSGGRWVRLENYGAQEYAQLTASR